MSFDRVAQRAASDLRSVVTMVEPAGTVVGLERTRRRRTAAAAVTAVVVATIAFGVVSVVRGPDREPPPAEGVHNGALIGTVDFRAEVLSGELALPHDIAENSSLQFTADGRELVYESTRGQVVAWEVELGKRRVLASCEGCAPVLSPDGTTLSVVTPDGFAFVDVRSGTKRPYPFERVGPMTWSPDGASIAVIDQRGLWIVDAATGDSRLIDRFSEPMRFYRVAQWSPDGQRLAYVAEKTAGDRMSVSSITRFTLVVLDADGSDRQELRDLGQCMCMRDHPAWVTWSPDGTRLAAHNLLAQATVSYALDGTDPRLLGEGATHLAWQPIVD